METDDRLTAMPVVDAQMHVWGLDSVEHPWDPQFGTGGGTAASALRHYLERPAVTGRTTVEQMDAAGVSFGVLIPPSIYGNSAALPLAVAAEFDGRFKVVAPLDPDGPGAARRVEDWSRHRHALGIRIVILGSDDEAGLRGGRFDAQLSACQQQQMPVFLFVPTCVDAVAAIAGRFPGLRIVIDHLGVPQPPMMAAEADLTTCLDKVCALAGFDNVAVKLTGLPSLSRTGAPFTDVHPLVESLLAAFGDHRLLWGSDWTRMHGIASYAETLALIRNGSFLSAESKARILGLNFAQLFGWPKIQQGE